MGSLDKVLSSHLLHLKYNHKSVRVEKLVDPVSGDPTGEEVVVHDTPLLINIKGCGYPPEVNCDEYAEFYSNQSQLGLTFPCHYSQMNPWIVLSSYNE